MMFRWLRDVRAYLKDRKAATMVLFVYPTSQLTGAEIKHGVIVMGEHGQMSEFRVHLRDVPHMAEVERTG